MFALLARAYLEIVTGSGTQCRKTDNHLALVDQAVRVRLPEIFRSYCYKGVLLQGSFVT